MLDTVVKSRIKVEVLVSTVREMTTGAGRSKWFTVSDYENAGAFYGDVLNHAQQVWGEKEPAIRLSSISTDMPFLGLVTEHGADNALWDLMDLGDVEQVKIVKAYIDIYGKKPTMKETIEQAIDLFQGCHDSDEGCVDQYINEFGSIVEADPDVSPYLSKEEYTAHFMKNISKSNGYYFND